MEFEKVGLLARRSAAERNKVARRIDEEMNKIARSFGGERNKIARRYRTGGKEVDFSYLAVWLDVRVVRIPILFPSA